jgi:predicted phosphodiesterase
MNSDFSTISVVAISDSHSMHSALQSDWPPADLFIHTGDLTQYGTKEELQSAITWLASLPFKHKVVIAGNHDIGLDKSCTYRSALARRVGTYATPEETDALIQSMSQHNIIYLSPEKPSVEIIVQERCVKIYGLPYSPLSMGPSAFMRHRTEDTWADVGEHYYDILLSHSPPRGYLDQTPNGDHLGCNHFLAAIERLKPAVAVFGHIHEARGSEMITWPNGTLTALYNSAIMNKNKTLSPPTLFDIVLPNR